MKLATFKHGDAEKIGIIHDADRRVFDL